MALSPRLNIRGPQVLRFLRHLARHVRGPVVLVWDRGNPHKHELVRASLARHPCWAIVWFPPYAPDLNPVELFWSYLKYGRLANFAPDTVDEIRTHVGRERRRLGRHPQLLRSFFRHSALPFRIYDRTLFTHLSLISCGCVISSPGGRGMFGDVEVKQPKQVE